MQMNFDKKRSQAKTRGSLCFIFAPATAAEPGMSGTVDTSDVQLLMKPNIISGDNLVRQNHAKSVVPVPVIRIVPVAVRTTHPVVIIVERAAAQNADCLSALPTQR